MWGVRAGLAGTIAISVGCGAPPVDARPPSFPDAESQAQPSSETQVAACRSAGEGEPCYLGGLYLSINRHDERGAFELFAIGCRRGHHRSCKSAADQAQGLQEIADRSEDAKSVCPRTNDASDLVSCREIAQSGSAAELLAASIGFRVQAGRRGAEECRASLERTRDRASACLSAVQLHMQFHERVPEALAWARELCAAEDAFFHPGGCAVLGDRLYAGDAKAGVAQNKAQGIALLKRACEGRSPDDRRRGRVNEWACGELVRHGNVAIDEPTKPEATRDRDADNDDAPRSRGSASPTRTWSSSVSGTGEGNGEAMACSFAKSRAQANAIGACGSSGRSTATSAGPCRCRPWAVQGTQCDVEMQVQCESR